MRTSTRALSRLLQLATSAVVLSGCPESQDPIFIGVGIEGPASVEVQLDGRPLFETGSNSVWNPHRVWSLFPPAEAVQGCARQGRARGCLTLPGASDGLRVTLDGTPEDSSRLEGFSPLTEDGLRSCSPSPFDQTVLDCPLRPGEELYVEARFARVTRFGRVRLRVEGAQSFAEASRSTSV